MLHNIDDFAYSNPAFGPNVTNLQQCLDWVVAVLYPTQKASVADVASLPTVGNIINDMRVVNDNGDGKSASYRWELREGEAVASWHKIYDVDFSTDSILAAWTNVTQDVYVNKYGRDDTDNTGTPVAGLLAGQSVFGGITANTNLNLFANSGDGLGANTGFIHLGDATKPTADDTFTLGTAAYRFSDIRAAQANLADFAITTGSIITASAGITFGSKNLTTTGTLSALHVISTGNATLATGTTIADFTFANGSLTSVSANIDFGTNGLITYGGAFVDQLNLVGNQITSDTGVIDFNNDDLTNITALDAQDATLDTATIGTGTPLVVNVAGNITKAAALSVTSTGVLTATGTTVALVGLVTTSSTLVATGKVSAPQVEATSGGFSILVGGASNVILATGGALDISDAAGVTLTAPSLKPTGTTDLGTSANLFQDLFLSRNIGLTSGNTIGQSALDCLRNSYTRKLAVSPNNGDTLFWDTATSSWYADHPDTEINHSELTNLTTDDHLQYLNINGRVGGQVAKGGTASGNNLVLESTAHATKGLVLYRDVLAPETDGTDLGTSSKQVGDLYTKGQAIGFRAENTTTITRPSASASKVGRLVFDSTPNALFVDTGGTWVRVGAAKFIQVDATGWTGAVTTIAYTTSSTISDATTGIWEFRKTTTGERLYPTITLSTLTVTVTFKVAIPSASYTLVGVA